jgi:hypothetical protein
MVMILREDRAKYTTKFEEQELQDTDNFYHNDEFLDLNWQNAMRKKGTEPNYADFGI